MKPILFVLLFIPVFSFGQFDYDSDTTCYSDRWIAIKNDSTHRDFFKAPDGKDLFSIIYRLNRANKLHLNDIETRITSCCFGIEEAKRKSHEDDTVRSYYDIEMNWVVEFYAFLSEFESDIPLIDGDPNSENFGNELIKIDPVTGEEHFVYPKADTAYIAFNEIYEMRIHENHFLRPKWYYEKYCAFVPEYQIEHISFAVDTYYGSKELFTINFQQFMTVLSQSGIDYENLPWFKMLMDQTYKGFRYKQASCYEYIKR